LTHFLLKIVRREKHWSKRPYSAAKLQRTNQTRTPSKHSIEFTHNDSTYHLKVNRDILALMNRRWKCKKGKGLTIRANLFTKIDQHDYSARCEQPDWEIPPSAGTNQIAGVC